MHNHICHSQLTSFHYHNRIPHFITHNMVYFYTLLVFISICSIFNFSSLVVSLSSHTLVMKLVHHTSIHSPIYNPNLTMLELSHLDLERSIARAAYLAQATNNDQFQSNLLETKIVAGPLGFFVYLEFGSNLIGQYVFLDTGSFLLWINCEPSQEVPPPLFNPRKSTTFRREYCNEKNNIFLGNPSTFRYGFASTRDCYYSMNYGSGKSEGFLVRDSLGFGSDILKHSAFGCSTRSFLNGFEFGNGVLGLGQAPLSFMTQMGASKFGYCIGNISDKNNNYNKLLISNDIKLVSWITELFVHDHLYISVEGMSIGVRNVDIDTMILRRNEDQGTGGVVLDSGSTYTFFPKLVVDKFLDELYRVMTSYTRRYGYLQRGYELTCYGGVIGDVSGFPKVRLWLSLGAIMELTVENMFIQYDDETFCLVILPLEAIEVPSSHFMLGMYMQQYFYFVFDRPRGRLAFKRMDCAQL